MEELNEQKEREKKTPSYTRKASEDYDKKFDKVLVRVPKGVKELIITKYGNGFESMNIYINRLITKDLEETEETEEPVQIQEPVIEKPKVIKKEKPSIEETSALLEQIIAENEHNKQSKELEQQKPKKDIENALNEPITAKKDAELEAMQERLRKKRENGELANPEKAIECAELKKHFDKK